MSRLPGTPLRGTTLTPRHLDALADALAALHTAVPAGALARLEPAPWGLSAAVAKARFWAAQPLPPGLPAPVRSAVEHGTAWLLGRLEEPGAGGGEPAVLGSTDGNLANYLWDEDGDRVRVVDFEDSGRSTRSFELAEITEHPSTWTDTRGFDAERFLARADLTPAQRQQVDDLRPVLAYVWLHLLLPGRPSCDRNPADAADRQARRLFQLIT